MRKRRYQEGGSVEDDDLYGGGALGALDPTTAFFSMFSNFNTTTPEAQSFSRRILEQAGYGEEGPEDPSLSPQSRILDQMRAQQESVREVLRQARETLLAQEYNKGDALLAVSGALGRPTRTGTIGETMSNVSESLRGPIAERREFDRDRSSRLSELDLQLAQADSPVIQAEFALEQLRQRNQATLAREALENLGKVTKGNQPPIPTAGLTARDRAFATDYNDWVGGGASSLATNISSLKTVVDELRSGKTALTGPIVGTISTLPVIGRGAQAILFPDSANVRNVAERVIQEGMTRALGSQFTAVEAANFMRRVFDPQLDEETVARNLEWVAEQLEKAYASKQAMAEYFESKNGTLMGFEGSQYTIDDFVPPWLKEEGSATPGFPGLSPEAQRSLRPGTGLFLQEDRQRARGGPVRRRYQEGGPVLDLEPEEGFLDLESETEPENNELRNLSDLWEMLSGGTGQAIAGGLGGLGAEAMLTGIARRLQGTDRRVIEAMERGGRDPVFEAEEIKRARRAGVPMTLMDVEAPGIEILTEEAMRFGGGDARQVLDRLEMEQEQARERVGQHVNRGLKPYPYFEHLDKLTRDFYRESKSLFDNAFAAHSAMPIDPVISAVLDTPAGKQAMRDAIKLFQNQPGKPMGAQDIAGMITKPSLEFYDSIVDQLDKMIIREQGRSDLLSPEGEAYRDLRNMFVERLDELAPEYRTARDQYAGDLEVRQAAIDGRRFDRMQPEELAAARRNMSFHEVNAYRTGMAQRLSEMINRPSGDNYNAAQQVIGSPAMVERMRPFFDTPAQFKLFQAALEKEAQMLRARRGVIGRGREAQVQRERDIIKPMTQTQMLAGGVRAFLSPLGVPSAWILRVIANRPRMTEAESKRVLDILQRGDPREMDQFIRRAQRSSRIAPRGASRTVRRGAAAALGAGAASLLSGDEEE